MRELHLFVSLLKFALGRASSNTITFTGDEWVKVYELAKKQAMVGVLFAGIERLSVNQLPPRTLLLQWYALTERIKQANRLLNRRAVETVRYFAENGFDACVLKGQGVATYYPDPLLRTSGDIDIWLGGERERIYDFARARVGLQGMTYLHIHYPLYEDVEIEVHTTPGRLSSPRLNCKLQRYFKALFSEQNAHHVALPDGVGEIPHPTVEFNLVYLLLHMYRHLTGEGIGLRQMMDYYYVLQQPLSEEARQQVVRRIEDFKMMRFACATMYVMREVFGLEGEYLLVAPDKKAGRFLLDEIMQAGNFGKYDARLKRKRNETAWFRLVRSLKRNARFLRYYPNEVLWNPVFRTWQYLWRLLKKK